MGFNQVHCMDTLKAATGAGAERNEFIYAFLDAYGFPQATTRVRNGDSRNLAELKDAGHVALKNWLYFMPVRSGESVHEAIPYSGSD